MTDPPEREQRLFTLEEASELLATVGPWLEQLQTAHAEMEALQEEVTASVPTNGGGRVHRAFADASERASKALRSITEVGIVVRDPSSGLIDFPAERDGHLVYLCWRLGEEGLAWWHPPDAGFAGRQPL